MNETDNRCILLNRSGAAALLQSVCWRESNSADLRHFADAMAEETFVESLINEVKQYPEIWKVNAEEYRDKVKKRAAWFKICEMFYCDFNEKSEKEKDELGKKLTNRWRNIKDTFMKSERKQSGRPYIYAKQLSFLREDEDRSATRSSFDIEEVNAHEPTTEMSSAEGACLAPSTNRPARNRRAIKRRRDLEESLINSTNTPIPSTTMTTTLEVDEDKSFFDSLLPTVKTFTIDQKLEFRSEVLNIAKKIRYSFLASSHQSLLHQQYMPSHSSGHQIKPFSTIHQQSRPPKTQFCKTSRPAEPSPNISQTSEDSQESADSYSYN